MHMHEGKPSSTALYVAIFRAAHQLIDRPLVFEDPLAMRILDPESRAALENNPHHFDQDPSAAFLRAILSVRSRIAEDALTHAVRAGVTQYVVLGAGLDTFAYRNPYSHIQVFEVDHPATQEWKLGRLEEGGITEPANVTCVAVDFTKEDLAEKLRSAGVNAAQFSWLGVTPYVSKDVISETLNVAASLSGESGGIVLDYVLPPETQPPIIQAFLAARRAQMKEIGEPWDSFFLAEEMEALLRGAGFGKIEDLGVTELNQRYFAGRADGLQVGSVGRVVVSSKNSISMRTHRK
jgi:methyltransferase (TIGR00027 family)